MILDIHHVLASHLGGHEAVGDAVGPEVFVQLVQLQANLVRDDVHRAAGNKRRVHIHHIGIKAIAGVGGYPAFLIQRIVAAIPVTEGNQAAVLDHAALGLPGCAGCV